MLRIQSSARMLARTLRAAGTGFAGVGVSTTVRSMRTASESSRIKVVVLPDPVTPAMRVWVISSRLSPNRMSLTMPRSPLTT